MDKIIELLVKESIKSLKTDDIPVGAIIVENNKIISKAHNCKEKYQIVTKHAEIIAIEKACKKKKNWHLDNCEIYITMEPCLMCKNAISQARIKKIYYILDNNKYKDTQNIMNNKIEMCKIDENSEKMSSIMKNFFKNKRKY